MCIWLHRDMYEFDVMKIEVEFDVNVVVGFDKL